jgi:hypothetical protein
VNDLQTKFAMTLVLAGLFFAYVIPTMRQMMCNRDAIMQQAGEVYIAPNPNAPNAPHGNVSIDQTYKDRKSSGRQ